MLSRLAQLKRLRGKSLRELRVRGRQELAKLGERVFSLSEGEMCDRTFLSYINPGHAAGSAEKTANAIVARMYQSINFGGYSDDRAFFPSLFCREEIASIMQRRFEPERQFIIDRADRAMRGRFDLLGFKDLSFGESPDWLLEPMASKRGSLEH